MARCAFCGIIIRLRRICNHWLRNCKPRLVVFKGRFCYHEAIKHGRYCI